MTTRSHIIERLSLWAGTLLVAAAGFVWFDGVMIGRQAYHHPYFLADLEAHFDATWALPDRADIVERMVPYIDQQLAAGVPLNSITRHMLGLFAGQESQGCRRRSWP